MLAFVWFEWGETIDYGHETTHQQMHISQGFGPFDAEVSGLSHSTFYHYRAVAENGEGISYGADKVFFTLSPSPPQILSFTSTSVYVEKDEEFDISWETRFADDVDLYGDLYLGNFAPNNTVEALTIDKTTTFKIVANGIGQSAERELTVTLKATGGDGGDVQADGSDDNMIYIIIIIALVVAIFVLDRWLKRRNGKKESQEYKVIEVSNNEEK